MDISRRGPGEASLVENGRDLLDLVAAEADEAEFEAVLQRLAALLREGEAPPRLAVTYREGLLDGVLADAAVDVTLIEEDPQDEPPLRLLHRRVAADPAGLEACLARIGGLPPGGGA